MLKGIDVASYQGENPDFSNCQVVAIKVSEGTTYTNPAYASQLKDAREHGCRVIFYHYPHIAESVSSQLGQFLGAIGNNLVDNDVLCLDWEWYGQSVSDQQARDFKDQWVNSCKNAKQNKCVIYSDLNNWKGVDTNSNCGDGLWIADYSSAAGSPNITHPWFGHQYSDKPMDEDVWNFSDIPSFDKWARENFVVTPPKTSTVDVRTEAGFGVWDYQNPDPGECAWDKLCRIDETVKKIAQHLGIE